VIQPRLRTRLTIWFAASILLILTPVLIGILVLQSRSMRAALDHHLSEDLEVAGEMLLAKDDGIVWAMESTRDVGYDAGLQRWVEVYTDGRLAFLRGVPSNDAIRATLAPPSPATSGFRTVRTPAGGYVRTLTAQHAIGPKTVWLRVARSEDALRRDLQHLTILFLIGAPLAVLAAAFSGYFISGWALSPLGRMADRARFISADHLSERLPVENTKDEMGLLAVVFNETFARIEASFDRLKQFTADASHELRTPLTAIRSVGEVGLREARDARGYQEIIGSMLEEADRLTQVVDTLLTLSRWESGRVRPSPERVDFGQVARDAMAQLSVLAEDRSVTMVLDLPRPLMVSTDPIMTRQAVMNVLDNAIKFTRPGGRIRVSGDTQRHEQLLIVDDEGSGIPMEHRHRVLERFYRLHEGGAEASRGSGLGLAIVNEAMTANHGSVRIDDNEAGGARVVLALPAADPTVSRP